MRYNSLVAALQVILMLLIGSPRPSPDSTEAATRLFPRSSSQPPPQQRFYNFIMEEPKAQGVLTVRPLDDIDERPWKTTRAISSPGQRFQLT